MEKENVLLIFGGNSFEHDISILTALTIYNKSKACKYKLLPLYLSKNEEWFLFLKDNMSIINFKSFNNNKIPRVQFLWNYTLSDMSKILRITQVRTELPIRLCPYVTNNDISYICFLLYTDFETVSNSLSFLLSISFSTGHIK